MAANIRKIAIRASYFPLEITIFRDKIIGSWNTKDLKSEDRERATIKIHVPRNMDPKSMFLDLGSKIHSTSLDNLYEILS